MRKWLALLSVLLFALPAGAVGENFVIILLDDCGQTSVTAYHPELWSPATTPNIDAWAAGGVKISQVFAEASCSPLRASLISGKNTVHHGVGRVLSANPDAQVGLDSSAPNLFKALVARGYEAKWVGKLHVMGGSLGLAGRLAWAAAAGFSAWEGLDSQPNSSVCALSGAKGYAETAANGYEWISGGACPATLKTDVYLTTFEIDRAIALYNARVEPQLLVVALNAAHAPFHCAPAALTPGFTCVNGDTLSMFQSMMIAADKEVKRLLDVVDASDTSTWVACDNGPILDTQKGFSIGHSKFTNWLGGVQVPLIAKGHKVTTTGTAANQIVHLSDFARTLLTLAGFPNDLPEAIDSRDFSGVLSNVNAVLPRKYVYTAQFLPTGLPYAPNAGTYSAGAGDGDYHLVQREDGTEQFFNTDVTPYETSQASTVAAGPAYYSLRAVIRGHGFRTYFSRFKKQ